MLKKKMKGTNLFYSILTANNSIPTAQTKWNKKLNVEKLPWRRYYLLPHKTTIDTKVKEFQFKLMHRILPTNYLLHIMNIVSSNLCTFCKTCVETLQHLFVECQYAQSLWQEVEIFLSAKYGQDMGLLPEDKLFGSLHRDTFVNHMILLTKKHIYFARYKEKRPDYRDLFAYIQMVRELERVCAKKNMTYDRFIAKWSLFDK